MNKAILVIDMPNSCNECKIRFDDEYSNWCPYDNPEPNGVWKYVNSETKPDWCPLKPAPKLIETNYGNDEQNWEKGYNCCVKQILGE